MVAVGIVFLLVNLGQLAARNVFSAFAEYWPAFLILWGVAKLVEHADARRHGAVAPGLGFGGWLGLLVIVGLGSVATTIYRHVNGVNWAGVREEMARKGEADFLLGPKYEFTQQIDQPLAAGGRVTVLVEHGSVRVLPGTDDSVHMTVRKSVYAYDQAEADAVNSRAVPQVTANTGGLVIDARRRAEWAGTRMSLEILVPPKAALDLSTVRGSIEVRGQQAAVKASAARGNVTLEDIGGPVTVEVQGGDVTARGIHGDVVVDGRVDDAVLSRIDGAVDIRGDMMGDVRADAVAKGVRLKSARTDLELARLDGDLRMGGNMLRVSSATGPLRLSTRSKDIELEGIKGDVKVANQNGDIGLEPDPRALGNIELAGRKGSVRLHLPAEGAFSLDARVDHGELKSDFDLAMAKEDGRTHGSAVVNKGGPTVSLSTEHGSILIRRR